MICPNTPKSVISKLMRKDGDRLLWNNSWQIFFDVYFDIVKLMAQKSLLKLGWCSISDADVDEIVSNTFSSLIDSFSDGKYKPSDDRHFRGFLKQIVTRRAVAFLRPQDKKRTISVESIEIISALHRENEAAEDYFEKLDDEEMRLYRRTQIMDLWESIRPAYSPETALIFEMRIMRGISVTEICEELNVDRTKVDKAVHRIRKKLREECQKENIGKDF